MIRLIPDKSASSVNQALKAILKDYPINFITADNGMEFSRLSDVFDPENIFIMPILIPPGRGRPMKITIYSFDVAYLREAKLRLLNKSQSLKIGSITIQRKY